MLQRPSGDWLSSAAAGAGQEHERDNEDTPAEADQGVTNTPVREVRADPDQEENARQEHRHANVLVRRHAGGSAPSANASSAAGRAPRPSRIRAGRTPARRWARQRRSDSSPDRRLPRVEGDLELGTEPPLGDPHRLLVADDIGGEPGVEGRGVEVPSSWACETRLVRFRPVGGRLRQSTATPCSTSRPSSRTRPLRGSRTRGGAPRGSRACGLDVRAGVAER